MEAKHTPGPWEPEAGVARGAWIQGSNGNWAALACGETDEEARANARLIAAAPDLYEALQQALAVHGNGYSWGPAAEAALAKSSSRGVG